jgi:hypothetical protein
VGLKLTSHLHFFVEVNNVGAILPVPHTSSWRGGYLSTENCVYHFQFLHCLVTIIRPHYGAAVSFTILTRIYGEVSFFRYGFLQKTVRLISGSLRMNVMMNVIMRTHPRI